jgi:hypothetical protein
VLFGEKVVQMSDAERLVRLQKIWTQLKDINLIEVFQMIGGRKDMEKEEMKAVFADFVKRHLGPQPRIESSPALASVYDSVKTRIGESYQLFSDPNNVATYERNHEAGKASQRSDAQSKLEEAKKFLSLKQYASATILLNKAEALYPKLDFLVLYGVWTKIGLLANSKNKAKDLAEIESQMARVPSEEKISAVGNLVQGLLAKAKNERAIARKFFEAALAVDKNLIDARRELNGLPPAENKKPDLLHADLGTVIGSLFKKN